MDALYFLTKMNYNTPIPFDSEYDLSIFRENLYSSVIFYELNNKQSEGLIAQGLNIETLKTSSNSITEIIRSEIFDRTLEKIILGIYS